MLLLLVSIVSFKYSPDQKNNTECNSFICAHSVIEKKQLITTKLSSTSSQSIYEEIKSQYSDKKSSEQHEIAHLFGQLLYQKKGIDEIGTCDSNFAFGCYHGFFIEAITDKGLGIVPDLDQACIKKFGKLGLGCQHGIGHGLMEFFGPKKLVQALQICGQLDWQKPLLGCAGGVFMEYNLPLNEKESSGISSARQFIAEKPYGECYEVPERFQQECFYNLGLWWNQVLHKDYQKMLNLCSSVHNPLLRERCLMGTGNAAATTSSLDLVQTKAYCDQSTELHNQTICRAGAAWVISSTPSIKDQAAQLCEDLSEPQKILCKQKINLMSLI